jgi:hypothetical protein
MFYMLEIQLPKLTEAERHNNVQLTMLRVSDGRAKECICAL